MKHVLRHEELNIVVKNKMEREGIYLLSFFVIFSLLIRIVTNVPEAYYTNYLLTLETCRNSPSAFSGF